MDEEKINQLFIFRRKANGLEYDGERRDNFELHRRIVVKDNKLFGEVSTHFHFKRSEGTKKDTLLFTTQEGIHEMNFDTEEIRQTYTFGIKLCR